MTETKPQLIWRKRIADTETPVSAALKLFEAERGDFILESVEGGETRGRHSLIGIAPDLVFRAAGNKAEINTQWMTDREAFVPTPLPSLDALRALAAELGITERVSFLGWRRDIGALLAAADMFICSSRQEPLGNIVLEAWSATKPVIAAAAQGPSELISDGKDGVLVPREDAAALAAAIAELADNPERAAAMAAAGRAHFAAAFAEAPVIAHWRRLLADLKPAGRA